MLAFPGSDGAQYYQSPYGNIGAAPMHPHTKTRVEKAWKAQFSFRVLGLVGGVGTLVCVVLIRGTSLPIGWIVRVAPVVACCHMIYATYFLSRAPNSRPPMSNASYHIFSALLDTGLLPFFVFTAYLSWTDATTNAYGWTTIVNHSVVDYNVILSLFALSVVTGVFCGLSLIFDVYMASMFRQIMQLPPDMNPLDDRPDNLTARPRHKRNKSELIHEKHLSDSTLASERHSKAQSGRRVPYMHSKTNSMDSPTFTHSEFGRTAPAMLPRADPPSPSRPSSAIMPDSNARSPGRGLDHQPARSSALRHIGEQPSSWLSYADHHGTPSTISAQSQQELQARIRGMSPVSALSDVPRRESPHPHTLSMGQNTCNTEDNMLSPTHPATELPPHYEERKPALKPLAMNPPTPRTYTPDLPDHDNNFQDESLHVRPLSVASHHTPDRSDAQFAVDHRPRQEVSAGAVPATRYQDTTASVYSTPQTVPIRRFDIANPDPQESYSRPASFIGSGAKSRYYGNLRVSVGGTHGHSSPTRDVSHQSFEVNDDIGGLHRNNTVMTTSSANFQVYASDSDADEPGDPPRRDGVVQNEQIEYDPYSSEYEHRHQYEGEREFDENPEHFDHDVPRDIHVTHAKLIGADLTNSVLGTIAPGRRQVSNSTGYDLRDGYAGLSAEFGRGMAARRREVSGKLAEEGRADGGVNAASRKRQGAAGWERFKGL